MITMDLRRAGAAAILLAGLAISAARCGGGDAEFIRPAYAHDADTPFADWMESLKQPDHPQSPCCGPADQVYVDNYEPSDAGGGFRALVKGAWIEIPPEKVIWDRVNPTGRGVLFMAPIEPMATDTSLAGYVYCFVPGSGT